MELAVHYVPHTKTVASVQCTGVKEFCFTFFFKKFNLHSHIYWGVQFIAPLLQILRKGLLAG